jgi:Ca2+-transporting ATPase
MQTELGRIASLLDKSEIQLTPLQKRLASFSKKLALAILIIAAVVFAGGLMRGEAVMLIFLTAISLAVAAIPEALPAVITISLALGAKNMGRLNALMRRLPAVETLGSVTVICSDKTGTLTRNEMRVEQIVANGQTAGSLSGVDCSKPLWNQLGKALALSTDVTLDDSGHACGEPTEIALYLGALDGEFIKSELERLHPRVAELSFSAERRCMTTLHQNGNSIISFTKGAPEAILPRCTQQLFLDGPNTLEPHAIHAQVEALAGQGYRVLAIAMRQFPTLPEQINPQHIENGLTFLGLVGLIDPPREAVAQAVDDCKTAGIVPVMITGDHPITAHAIAKRLGILEAHQNGVITGVELNSLSDMQLKTRVGNIRVYARASPEQKIRIVKALQHNGEFVAMTGDGVNDAPALKQADIGVAMGKKGTDVAREASDMILVDDNFATIVAAIREGRRIFDNIRKFIKYTMTSNSGEIWTLFLAPFLGLPIPLLPIQILWINLVTDGLPGLALSAEPQERGIMHRPPRPPQESIFAHGMWQHMVGVGLLIGGLSLAGQAWAYHSGSENWQTVVFTVLTFSQLVQVLVIRSERESLITIGLFSNLPLLGAVLLTVALQLMVIYLPFFNAIFHTSPLKLIELLVCFALPMIVFVVVEIEKLLVRRKDIYGRKKNAY